MLQRRLRRRKTVQWVKGRWGSKGAPDERDLPINGYNTAIFFTFLGGRSQSELRIEMVRVNPR